VTSIRIVEWNKQSSSILVVRAALDPECTLSWRGEELHFIEELSGFREDIEPRKSGGSEDNPVELAAMDLSNPGFDVTAYVTNDEVGP
tara:strand:- start:93 stop:356 length:264 start_codon:yes stop_codon:yes gene_type:complete